MARVEISGHEANGMDCHIRGQIGIEGAANRKVIEFRRSVKMCDLPSRMHTRIGTSRPRDAC